MPGAEKEHAAPPIPAASAAAPEKSVRRVSMVSLLFMQWRIKVQPRLATLNYSFSACHDF
jgi:hypothetical protein